jgi:hypothetical protein
VPQLSQVITSQWCFAFSAAAILGQNQTLAFGGKDRVEAAHCGHGGPFFRPLTAHPRDVVADFIVARVVAHRTEPIVREPILDHAAT